MRKSATLPCWELRVADDVEGECGEASDRWPQKMQEVGELIEVSVMCGRPSK